MFERFRRNQKTLQQPNYSVIEQIEKALQTGELKSLTLPELRPRWGVGGMSQNWDTKKAIVEGYDASAVVYAAVEKRAKLIASVPWNAQKLVGDTWENQPDSPLQKLIKMPNTSQSWYELMYALVQQMDLSGNGYLSEIKGGINGTPFELWLLPSEGTSIKAGTEKLISEYQFNGEMGKRKVAAEDMIHLKRPNPNSPYFGMPVLMAAGRATDIDREAGNWQKTSFQNRSVADLHIEVPEGATKEQRDEVREKVKERQAGPANARAPIVSSGKVNQLGQNAVEMDFIQSKKSVWTEIAACFGVPLAMLGFTEDVNLANADAMKRLLWEDTIIPELDLIKRQITHQLASEFESGNEQWRIEPDTSNIAALKDDLSSRLDSGTKMLSMGYTRNEINERLELGFDETDGGDVRYEPVGLIPQGLADNDDDPSDDGVKDSKAIAYGK